MSSVFFQNQAIKVSLLTVILTKEPFCCISSVTSSSFGLPTETSSIKMKGFNAVPQIIDQT